MEKRTRPDGSEREILLGTPYRIRTIVDTNIAVAFSAGRYKAQTEAAAARPY